MSPGHAAFAPHALLALVCLAGPGGAWAARGPVPLDALVGSVRAAAAQGVTPYVVFDLDGTLFDPSPRTWHIFRDCAREQRERFPGLIARIEEMDPSRFAWPYSPESALARGAVRDSAAVRALLSAWRERFFTGEALDDDVALPGAATFVDSLHRAGAGIVYLTGRPVTRMLEGTVRSLQRAGFPVGVARTQVILKPRPDLRDGDFKVPAMRELARGGRIVAAFENEPGNINAMHEAFPEARALYVHTTHARAVPIQAGIDTVTTYLPRR